MSYGPPRPTPGEAVTSDAQKTSIFKWHDWMIPFVIIGVALTACFVGPWIFFAGLRNAHHAWTLLCSGGRC